MENAPENSALINMLQSIMSQWTSPDFMTAVAAREGVHLDPASIVAVTILGSYGPQRPSALAARMVTGASNISKIAARLQEAGLVEKLADPKDSRASRLALTAAGTDTAAALVRSGNSLATDLVGEWSAGDRDDLLRLLTRFEVETKRMAAEFRQDRP
ncbi:MarR family winged helix-turn-helix transcriptional regulator [Paeniglutamicibacter sp. NPDC012692]|uniref:MarR family winged helix-turn-helix transcriptional regulator n=1 Tax=Paeniglutamicibacter sp. NPDC012692 TaxID=3364388 RepID=UPI0036A81872